MNRGTGDLAHLLLGQPDLAEQYMRALALKGQLPAYTGAQFEPSITVLDLRDPEYLWLRRTTRLSQGIVLAAVAAQFSQAAFLPIAGAARAIAVVEQLILTNSTATATTVFVDSQPVSGLTAAPGVPKSALDDRALPFNQLQPTPSFGWLSATAAAAIVGTGAMLIGLPAGSSVILQGGWVFTARVPNTIPAPSALLVSCGTVNQSIHAAAIWRERAMAASEGS